MRLDDSTFPRPLVSPERLIELLSDPATRSRIRPVDVRWKLNVPEHGRLAFATGHLPGAIFLDLDTELADPNGLGAPGRHPLPDPAAFARLLGDVGIGDEAYVVAYDDAGGTIAARLWWMLDDLGHEAVAVLDGGIDAWRAAGGEVTTDAASWRATSIGLRDRWTRAISRDELRERLPEVLLLDVRARERYRGDLEPVDPVGGHVPGATNAPTTELLADGRLLPDEALRDRLRGAGAGGDAGRDVVVSCGSGVTAAHTALALRAAALPVPILYADSYSDWSRSGLRVATGDEPGEM
jgi:thiosulfate/3-mercaptopyruvate sulfurtransferase